uniref:Reverse transcriptase domain-containing protein n=1 Tax=Fagus sylvatica TaxID=28930 RepID=A0A2N9EE12_FAGSY
MSEIPRSVGWESRSPAQKGSSKTLYEPSWPTETPYETSEEATAERASAKAPPQHTDPNEGKPLNIGEPSRSRPPLYGEKNPQAKKHSSRKTTRPEEQNVVWRALDLVSSSPFSREIEKAQLPERYTAPRFEAYNGRTDPVAHIGHYQQTMAVSRFNDPLMCRLFPSSLGEVAMRWFNQLGRQTIDSWDQMAKAFWETYNDIDGRSEEVAIKAFKLGLPIDSGLRQSLVKRPPSSLVKLMNKIDQFVRLEEDGKGATPVQTVAPAQEPIYKIMEKIKREPFFVWPPKLLGNPVLGDGKLYCTYHRDTGHMTENCHMLKVHLEKLVSAGHLNQYIDADLSDKKEPSQVVRPSHSSSVPSAGVIHVIHNPLCFHCLFGVLQIQDAKGCPPQKILLYNRLRSSCPNVYGEQRKYGIDQGSFAEVMYQDLYMKLGLGEAELSSFTSPIYGFSGEPTVPLGKTILPVLTGPINLQTEFIVVKASSPYNAIMGRDWLHRMRAIPSTLHQKLRFPTKDGIMELNGDQVTANQCVLAASQEPEDGEIMMTERPEKVFFDPSNPEQFFLVGSKLSAVDGEQLLQILIDNRDVFAWSVYDAPSVSPELASSGVIREVQYPMWLSNTVVVKKKNGKWRVCIDFTDLNKTCLKDPFPLPWIDQLVDSASRHARLSFLDSFQGYHQIPMNVADQDKTAFITPRGTYYYKVMPFGLKNAGATYQIMVTKMFGHMIGKMVEVYIDDMLVKSLLEENHVSDLLQVFDILRESCLRLNASKCTFGVSSGKFLGHVVSRRGIEANPDQIAALVDLAEPRNIKQLQRLTSMVAALGRFISRSADKCKPFFRLLGRKSKFVWDEECLVAFQGIKTYLSTPPCLSIPIPGEPLFLYLAVSNHAVSAVLVRELGQQQKPIFFVHVEYKPRTAIKGQVLAEFLAEFQHDPSNSSWLIPAETQLGLVTGRWELYVDGASNFRGSGAGIVLLSAELDGPILSYLKDNKLPEDKKEAKMIKRKTPRYWVSNEGLLYRRSFTGPYLLCVHSEKGDISGYWWPSMQADSLKYVRECDKCQRFAPMIHQPARELNPLSSPWPFAQWGLDIVGPLPRAPGNKRFLIVATNYFTKWVEAEPLSNIRDVEYKTISLEKRIQNFFSSPGYPQSNGQAEVSNKVILSGIKKKLEAAKGKWVEELPSVLWTHRTTVRKSTGETPFALAFGVEAVIPLEVGMSTTRTTEFVVETNEENLRKDLDLLEERRDLAVVRLASYQ